MSRRIGCEIGHEATVSKVGEDQLFYVMSRGLARPKPTALIVNGFIEPITKEIPMEYAVELNRLIQLEMSGSRAKFQSQRNNAQTTKPPTAALLFVHCFVGSENLLK